VRGGSGAYEPQQARNLPDGDAPRQLDGVTLRGPMVCACAEREAASPVKQKRASLVPAAAVIPALQAMLSVAAVVDLSPAYECQPR